MASEIGDLHEKINKNHLEQMSAIAKLDKKIALIDQKPQPSPLCREHIEKVVHGLKIEGFGNRNEMEVSFFPHRVLLLIFSLIPFPGGL